MARNKPNCNSGHPLTPDNIRLYGPNKTWIGCMTCKYLADKKQRERPGNRAKALECGRQWRIDHRERSRDFALKNYDLIREYIDAAKDFPCMDCGISYPSYVMDFDHRDPKTKKINVGRARSLKAAKEEIAKCDLVCANCHRERTWKEHTRGWAKQNCS